MGKKPNKIAYYRYKQDKKQYIYVLKHQRMSFWNRLLSRVYDYPPHIDLLYEKILIVYEE